MVKSLYTDPINWDGPQLLRIQSTVVLLCELVFDHEDVNNTYKGWSGGAKVLGKLPVLGRPTNLDYSRARAYCACIRCGWGLFGHFFSHLSLLYSFSLSLGDGPI